MVRNQDDASFLPWTATLHPESAATSIPAAALQRNRNPLEVVYHEIASDDAYFDGLPVALQVVAVDDDDDDEEELPNGTGQHFTSSSSNNNGHGALSRNDPNESAGIPATNNTPGAVYRPKPWRHSNTIDLILGFMLSFVAWVTTVKLEVTAFVIYAIAALFHAMAEKVFGQSPATLLCKSIFSVLTAVMMIVDSVLIMVSVLVTEILGAIALFLCTFFGGPRSGTEWHLFIRRTCHLTRWGFRSCLTMGWKPERIFPISESAESASLQPPPSSMNEMNRRQSPHSESGIPEYRDHITPDEEAQPNHTSASTCGCCRGSTCGCTTNDGDETTISTLTTATILPSEMPPVAIAAEHVHVLDDENANEYDETDGYFTKNTQQVFID